MLFAFMALGVVSGGAASAEECSSSITAEEVLRAEDARYAAQIANDFAAMEQMFGPELVYIRSVDGAVADKHAYIESMRSGTVKYRAMRRSDVRVRTYGCLAMIRLLRVGPYREGRGPLRAGSVPQRVGQARRGRAVRVLAVHARPPQLPGRAAVGTSG